jgi:hypothetical protein
MYICIYIYMYPLYMYIAIHYKITSTAENKSAQDEDSSFKAQQADSKDNLAISSDLNDNRSLSLMTCTS